MELVWLSASHEGYCGRTIADSGCTGRDRGSWTLDDSVASSWRLATAECLRLCASCRQCRFMSLSIDQRDCSWSRRCDVSRLDVVPAGYRTARRPKPGSNTSSSSSSSTTSSGEWLVTKLLADERRQAAQRSWVDELQRTLPSVQSSEEQQGGAARRAQRGLLLLLGVSCPPNAVEERSYARLTLRASTHQGGAVGFEYRFVVGTVISTPLAHASESPQPPQPGPQLLTRLRAEAATHGDLALLEGVRDGAKDHLSAKTLAWFVHAARRWPHARFVGKSDVDTFVVVPRVLKMLRLAEQQVLVSSSATASSGSPASLQGSSVAAATAEPPPLLVGRMQVSSFDEATHDLCGCCGYSLSMGRGLLHAARAVPRPCGEGEGSVAGPFYFGIGPFFALSRGALTWLGASPPPAAVARAAAAVAPGGSVRNGSFAAYADEIFLGHVLSHCEPPLRAVELGAGAIHNVDAPRVWPFGDADAACVGSLAGAVAGALGPKQANLSAPADWLTGHPARWRSIVTGLEKVSLKSAAVHHVVGAAQWRRIWALSSHWTRQLERLPRARRRCVFGRPRLLPHEN